MKTASISDFRANIKKYMDAVIRDNEDVLINRGSTGAVLVSLDEYNSIRGTAAILSSDRQTEAVERGIKELSEGAFEEINIDAL